MRLSLLASTSSYARQVPSPRFATGKGGFRGVNKVVILSYEEVLLSTQKSTLYSYLISFYTAAIMLIRGIYC